MLTTALVVACLVVVPQAWSDTYVCSPVVPVSTPVGFLSVLGPVPLPTSATLLANPNPMLQFPSLTTATSVSVAFWVQMCPGGTSCSGTAFSLAYSNSSVGTPTQTGTSLMVSLDASATGQPTLRIYFSSSCYRSYPIAGVLSTYVHVVVATGSNIGSMVVYINGRVTAPDPLATMTCSSPLLYNGGQWMLQASVSGVYVSNLRFFDRAIDQPQVSSVYSIVPVASYSGFRYPTPPWPPSPSPPPPLATGPILPVRSYFVALDSNSNGMAALTIPSNIGYYWSLSFWVVFPMAPVDTFQLIGLYPTSTLDQGVQVWISGSMLWITMQSDPGVCPTGSISPIWSYSMQQQTGAYHIFIGYDSNSKQIEAVRISVESALSCSVLMAAQVVTIGTASTISPQTQTSKAVGATVPATPDQMRLWISANCPGAQSTTLPAYIMYVRIEYAASTLSLSGATGQATKIRGYDLSAMQAGAYCQIGANADAYLFPPPYCVHGSGDPANGCKCDQGWAGAQCRQCAPTFVMNFTVPSWPGMGACQCPPSSFVNGTVCQQCPTGRYTSLPDMTSCAACPSGTVTNAHQTGCISCQAGYAPTPAQDACQQCSQGYYSDSGTTCTLCPYPTPVSPAGSQNASLCTYCRSGQVAVQGALPPNNVCQNCDPGTFATNGVNCSLYPMQTGDATESPDDAVPSLPSRVFRHHTGHMPPVRTWILLVIWGGILHDLPGATSCTTCLAGTQANSNMTACLPCPDGQYSAIDGSACISCSDPYSVTGLSMTACKPCGLGKIPDARQQVCVSCPANQIRGNLSSGCQSCDPGLKANATECQACPPGYQADSGGRCAPCDPGHYTPQGTVSPPVYTCQICTNGTQPARGVQCEPCPPATYGSAGVCTQCPGGTYNNATGMTSCSSCPKGSFSSVKATGCTLCDLGQYAPLSGSGSCSLCQSGQYADTQGSSSCKPCPPNSNSNAIRATSRSSCSCKPGYYQSQSPTVSDDGYCTPCPIGGNCTSSGTIVPGVLPGYYRDINVDPLLIVLCSPSEACLAAIGNTSTTCAAGYRGIRCGTCGHEYFRLNNVCIACGSGAFGIVMLAITIFFVCCAFLVSATPSKAPFTSLGISLSSLQLIAVFANNLTDYWTPEIKTSISIASAFNLNLELFRPECAVHMDYWTKQQIKLTLPLMAMGLLLFITAMAVVGKRAWALFRGKQQSQHASTGSQMDVLTVSSTMKDRLIYASTATRQRVVQVDPSVSCNDPSYDSHIWFSYMSLFTYAIGIPVLFGAILGHHYKTCTLSTPKFERRFGDLTSPYTEKFFWWEVLNMFRRLVLLLTVNLIGTKFTELFSALAALFLALVLQSFCNPFRTTAQNRLSTLWNIYSVLILFSAAVLQAGANLPTGPTSTQQLILTVMVFVGFFCIVCYSIYCIGLELKLRQDLRRESQRDHLGGPKSLVQQSTLRKSDAAAWTSTHIDRSGLLTTTAFLPETSGMAFLPETSGMAFLPETSGMAVTPLDNPLQSTTITGSSYFGPQSLASMTLGQASRIEQRTSSPATMRYSSLRNMKPPGSLNNLSPHAQ
ncbi:hypothetical protein PBRA_007197 [Plasmodiophora brassicae]|uniref:Tyrosine-protein kinase ephrin type A/B receptor-like domain-containing protein n=1 Tax=Plasmodiophora brassicae TaxID=37360 RepID=A0A0G4IUR3_PLABS|nr:hypothetical protein PBRA_007197 [Plasmodiophora brassicae]